MTLKTGRSEMTFAGIFRLSWSALPVNEPRKTRVIKVWATFKEWSRVDLEHLLACEPCDDPTAHLDLRNWADLPPHHPESPE